MRDEKGTELSNPNPKARREGLAPRAIATVSYTHLTLPTICSV